MKEENVKSEYQRKVDKSLIPTCNIMGVNIAAINMNWLCSGPCKLSGSTWLEASGI